MRHSLNEIEVTLRTAGRAVGLPLGLARELARAGAWLAAAGLPPLDLPLAALRGLDQGRSTEGCESRSGHPASVCFAAPAACDLLAAGEEGPVIVDAVDLPSLAVAYAACASRRYGTAYRLAWETSQGQAVEAIAAEGAVHVAAPLLLSPHASRLVVTINAEPCPIGHLWGGPGCVEFAAAAGVEVSDTAWEELSALAARMLVPSSEHSRARGAGAGLIDTD